MKYTLNDYLPYIEDKCTRLEIYPNNKFAAKLISEYSSKEITVVPVRHLVSDIRAILRPINMIDAIRGYSEDLDKVILYVGLDGYLALLSENDRRDFIIGIRGLVDEQKLYAHFLISSNYYVSEIITNPKYEGATHFICFEGAELEEDISITIAPSAWVQDSDSIPILVDALRRMGDYIPSGTYLFTMNERELPAENYENVYVIHDPRDALQRLYNMTTDCDFNQAEILLKECKAKNISPLQVLENRFGGKEYLSCDRAPARLFDLRNDELWDLYVWLLRRSLSQNTYLYKVLQRKVTPENFLEEYVVNTAIGLLEDKNIKSYSEERGMVVRSMNMVDPLIARFVHETEDNENSLYFMNCGTSAEARGAIRRAAKHNLQIELPPAFDKVTPALKFYISPDFDYSNKRLTEYFSKLRMFRIRDSIDAAFVAEAYEAKVPKEIKKRDQIIGAYDDGETALLVVDGLGAEYYPLLLNMAAMNNLKIQEKQLVAVNLPSSTSFNPILWSKGHELAQVKCVDNISHNGYSKYEKCGYEENLAEIFEQFQKTILTRVVEGLKTYKRVVVTADHGSSCLAVTAYREGLVRTIPWENPEDWRYASLPYAKECSQDFETVYRPDSGYTYYVVKGYNRLPKSGGKLYGLHGGATLEERLVPLVVFTNEKVTETIEEAVVQFIEDDDFDI